MPTATPERPNLLIDAIKRAWDDVTTELAVTPERPSPDQLLTTAQLAALLQVSERTLEAWRSDGRGPAVTRVGGTVRYRYADVLTFIAVENGLNEKGPDT